MDLGLDVDRAKMAVRDDDKKKKKSHKKRQKSPRIREGGHFGPVQQDFENVLQRHGRHGRGGGAGGSPVAAVQEAAGARPFLLHAELSDSDDEESSDEESEGVRQRLMRDGSRKKLSDSNRYRTITGNVFPTELSISINLKDQDILRLTGEENYGVIIQPSGGFWQVGKKNRKAKRAHFDVSVMRYEFKGLSSTGGHDEDEPMDDDEATTQTSAIIYGEKKAKERTKKRKNRWPPPALNDNPPPPAERPPMFRTSTKFMSRPKASMAPPPSPQMLNRRGEKQPMAHPRSPRSPHHPTRSPPLHPPRSPLPPRPNGAMGAQPPPRPPPRVGQPGLRKQPSLTSMVTASVVIKKNMKKLAKFRGPSAASANPVHQAPANRVEDRFLVSKKVSWVVPPPPRPRQPPPDGSDAQQLQLDFELLGMFCEDLRSTAVKLKEKQDIKSVRIAQLQQEVSKMDDEIAGLVQPKGLNHSKIDVITSQLKSVTSGNIFRVEKY